jgi:hypothetical protein
MWTTLSMHPHGFRTTTACKVSICSTMLILTEHLIPEWWWRFKSRVSFSVTWREDWRCAKLPWHAPEYCKRKNPVAATCLMQNLKKSAASTTVEQAICYHDDWLQKRCFYCWVCCCRFGWDFHRYRDLRCHRTCSAAAHYRCSFEGCTTIWSCQSCFWSLRESNSGPSQNVYNSCDVTAWVQ